jgi:hypothetical protein
MKPAEIVTTVESALRGLIADLRKISAVQNVRLGIS